MLKGFCSLKRKKTFGNNEDDDNIYTLNTS